LTGFLVESDHVAVLCRHNKPVPELRPITASPNSPGTPRFGLREGFGVPDSFFEPLPDDLVKASSGE
jgi:hypothetical protein